MVEFIKEEIWLQLKEREVSLAIIYDERGFILWHRGREISGSTVKNGRGFASMYIERAFAQTGCLKTGGFLAVPGSQIKIETALFPHIKSVIIQTICDGIYLYIDSQKQEVFTSVDREVFKAIGSIMGETVRHLRNRECISGGITGSSDAVKSIREQLITYSMVNDPALLTGETGTGKNRIAELLHNCSGRKGKFKTIHSPGIPDNLFENEMFGHKKGAFTGALNDKKGLVEEAAGGTLFIDEITEVSPLLQAKLLRFIETGHFLRLGDSNERKVDVRIVAATNKNILSCIEKKEFREDLYYRLNVFEIQIPPLRERKEDIKDLVLEKINHLNGKKIGTGFWKAIHNHHWPGNIRELSSVLKRAGTLPKDTVSGEDIRNILLLSSPIQCNDSDSLYLANQIWNDIRGGKNFWDTVKKPFMSRELKRSEVKAVIHRGLNETRGKYNKLLKVFNLDEGDYHRFMRFLHDQGLLLDK